MKDNATPQSAKKINKAVYENDWTEVSSSFKKQSPGNKLVRYLISEALGKASLTEIKSILDVGCGEGSKTAFLKEKVPNANILGIDFTVAGIQKAMQNYPPRKRKMDFALLWRTRKTKVSGKTNMT